MLALTDDQITARFLFLLEMAGEHRACVLGEFVNVTTADAMRVLSDMRKQGLVVDYSVGSTQYWRFVKKP